MQWIHLVEIYSVLFGWIFVLLCFCFCFRDGERPRDIALAVCPLRQLALDPSMFHSVGCTAKLLLSLLASRLMLACIMCVSSRGGSVDV